MTRQTKLQRDVSKHRVKEKRAPSARAGRGSSAEIRTQNTELPVWVAEPALERGSTQEGICSDKTEALMELSGCFDGKNYLKGQLALHNLTESLQSSQTACPFFQKPQALLFFLSSSQSSLFSQAGLAHQLIFQHKAWPAPVPFRTSFLNNVQSSWAPLPFRNASKRTLLSSLLNRPRSVLHKSRAAILLTSLLTSRIKNQIS